MNNAEKSRPGRFCFSSDWYLIKNILLYLVICHIFPVKAAADVEDIWELLGFVPLAFVTSDKETFCYLWISVHYQVDASFKEHNLPSGYSLHCLCRCQSRTLCGKQNRFAVYINIYIKYGLVCIYMHAFGRCVYPKGFCVFPWNQTRDLWAMQSKFRYMSKNTLLSYWVIKIETFESQLSMWTRVDRFLQSIELHQDRLSNPCRVFKWLNTSESCLISLVLVRRVLYHT